MRIIAGKYRGRILKSPPDVLRTRPTSDRMRETLFNVLSPRINESTRFLDLCAGTGAVGIEALSRDAQFVTFVERSRKACALIETNLDLLEIPEECTQVVMSEAAEFLRRVQKKFTQKNNPSDAADQDVKEIEEMKNEREDWDIVFFDPPYTDDYRAVLELFGREDSMLLHEDAVVIAEHHHKNEVPDLVHNLRRWRRLKQGDSCLSFYELQ